MPHPLPELAHAYPTVDLAQALNYCPAFNLLYVLNPKAACSSIKLMLSRAQSGDWTFDPPNMHVEGGSLLPKPQEIGWTRMQRVIAGEAFRFTFVRDPVERLLSGYSDKIVRQAPRFAGGFKDRLGLKPDEQVPFEGFLEILEGTPPEEMNQHWRPQSINVMAGSITYDFIGKVERFDSDFAKLRDMTGFPDLPLAERNRRPRRISLEGQPDLVRRIRRIYEMDCERFDY